MFSYRKFLPKLCAIRHSFGRDFSVTRLSARQGKPKRKIIADMGETDSAGMKQQQIPETENTCAIVDIEP